MARIERKVRFVGVWRENVVTDITMRQIVARAHAEKGQKARLRLSAQGMSVTRTVMFQEQVLTSLPLKDIYFLTLNQRHATCLLSIVADPTRKYCIIAVKAATVLDAQQIIAAFNQLKNDPALEAGNVVLRRKDNGNWTLRERSAINANRHLLEVFDDSPEAAELPQNGDVPGYVSALDLGASSRRQEPIPDDAEPYLITTPVHPQTYTDFGGGVGTSVSGKAQNGELADIRSEVEQLSQELRDIRMMVEHGGVHRESSVVSSSSRNVSDDSYRMTAEVRAAGGDLLVNGRSDGRPGEARAVVEDYRQKAQLRSSSVAAEPVLVVANGRVQRQITVPDSRTGASHHHHDFHDPQSPVISGHRSREDPDTSFASLPAHTVQRQVSSEFVTLPYEGNRKWSAATTVSSRLGSGGRGIVTFEPKAFRHGYDQKSRTLRYRAGLSVPSTVLRPIEETYGPPRHMTLRRHPMYVIPDAQGHLLVTSASGVPVRRRPASMPVMQGSELRVYEAHGDADEMLL